MSNVINNLLPRLKLGESFTLTEICNKVNSELPLHMAVKNVDIKKYLEDNFEKEIQFSVPLEANKPTLVFHSSVTLAEVVDLIRSKDVLKESAKILQKSLFNVDFDLNDKFCDETNLRHSWDNMRIPQPLLIFFQSFLTLTKISFTKIVILVLIVMMT